MTTHEASSSSSSKSKHWNYDVYLSFRGEDTHNGFTGHLHAALTDRGYKAFIDEDNLKRGEEIKELFRVIEEARISIIVFSKHYADSRWCLDELVKIMECRYKLGRRVLPVFYHVDPSHVRRQDGYLAHVFQKHEDVILEEKDDEERKAKQERVKQWRRALTQAADLAGPHLTYNGREAKLIREIVDKIIPKWLLIVEELHVAKHLVGIYTRIQGIITYLSNGGSDVVRMVGIWGMVGLGKTTAAKAIYNEIHQKFQFKSFLANVSEYDPVNLQGKLVSDIMKQTESRITSVHQGISLIKNNLQRRCVLVIIDNVDKVEQLNAIAGNPDWFGPGSRIIITTRDERLLSQVDKTYTLKKMNGEEALKLFSWHAFGNSWPDEGYLELSKEFVSYCDGLPLALEVLGSSIIERTPTEWKSKLEKLKKFPDEGDNKILPFLNKHFDGGTKSKSKHWNYDVYLSFCGVDTRDGFTGHLHAALTDRGYQAYLDQDDLESGEDIKEELFRVIEEARISIIVFSKRYAKTSWCLDELVKIMECRDQLGQRVLPIFYHVDPSYVRNLNGDLAEAFQQHEEGVREEKDDEKRQAKQERVNQWRKALIEAANLSGRHLRDNGHEAKLIREIVGEIITEWLPSANELDVAKHPVGINSRVQDIINHPFDDGTNGRRIRKLVISSTEISKGSNGTIVLEGVYEGRRAAVKRLVSAHHEMASKEIQNLIASDRHPNIVRLYGVEQDKDFVYISLERCICNLDDLIQIFPNSSQNPVAGEEDAKRARIENEVNNIMLDVNLWKVDGSPSLQLLKLMRDVVSGLVHLHEIGIIHRDLKPQNVLLIKERNLCAKLSDMGISKCLSGDMSSLGHLATGNSGWQAPEQILHGRQTRAVDMFSLGCLLFYCITGGRHPFGDQLERDINIVRNQMDLFLVEHIPEAVDLISRLLNPDPEIRPKASEVLLHPLFWDSETRLSFLRDSSDRVELEDRVANSGVLTALESIAPIAFEGKWDEKMKDDKKMEDAFLTNISLGRYRRYKFDSVRDLLRVIRNKSNHYRELPQQIQELVGPVPEGFYFYFSSRFPRLLIEVYKVVCQNCREEECFGRYFKSNAD